MTFLDELKRRKVIRVAVVYAATAFVVLQAADLFSAGLALPSWVFAAITLVTILGFPLALVLAWAFQITPDGVQRTVGADDPAPVARPPAWLGRGTLLGSGVLVGVGAVLAAGWVATPDRLRPAAEDAAYESRAYALATLVSIDIGLPQQPDRFAVSPDGRTVVMVNHDAMGVVTLLLRRRGQLEAVPLVTGEQPRAPVFSPDGRHIAWVDARSGLMKMALPDGQPVRVAGVQGMKLTWGGDDRIRLVTGGIVHSVHAVTGQVETLELGTDTVVVRAEALPRGRLLLSLLVADSMERIVVRERDGRVRELLEGLDAKLGQGSHLLFTRREGAARVLMAAPLDRRRAALRGEPVTLVRNIATGGALATPAAASASGDLVYLATLNRTDRRVVLLDRRGFERELDAAGRGWNRDVVPSPDGSMLAGVISGRYEQRSVWTLSATTHSATPLNHGGDGFRPKWTPDGRTIVFSSFGELEGGGSSMFRAPADGTGPVAAISASRLSYVLDVSSDGRLLLYWHTPTRRLHIQPLAVDSPARPLLPVLMDELSDHAGFSPDVKWVAFVAMQSGRRELRMARLDDPARTVPVTRVAANGVGWSRDGRYFYSIGQEVWEVRVDDTGPRVAEARQAFTLPQDMVGRPNVMPDGEHLALIRGGHLYSDLVMLEGALAQGRAGARRSP